MPPVAAPAAPDLADRTESFMDWVQLHTRELLIGLILVGVVALGAFLYQRNRASTERNAERAFFAAQARVQSGDAAAAEGELSSLAGAYPNTAGGTQAALTLAQLRYDAGKYDEGLATLRRVQGGAPDEFKAAVQALIAAGLEGKGSYAEAAQAYQQAAEQAAFDLERQAHRADAARVLTLAGNTQGATAIWQELANDPTSPFSAEARVRLGELQAQPAGQS